MAAADGTSDHDLDDPVRVRALRGPGPGGGPQPRPALAADRPVEQYLRRGLRVPARPGAGQLAVLALGSPDSGRSVPYMPDLLGPADQGGGDRSLMHGRAGEG